MATKTRAKGAAAKSKKGDEGVTLDLSRLSDEQFAELLLAAGVPDEEPEDDEDDEDEDVVDEVDDSDSDDEDDDPDEDDEDDEDGEEDDEPPVAKRKTKRKVKEKVSLSEPVKSKRRKVSNGRQLQLLLAEQRWETKREKLASQGVPPYLLDLAEPVMASPDKVVIDLSETGEDDVDAKKVISKMLEASIGVIDLSAELGHSLTGVERDKDGNPTNSLLTQWESEYGQP